MLLLRPDRSQYHNSNAWVAFIRTSAPTLPGLCFLCQHICNVANLLVPIHCSLMYTPKNEPEIVIDLSQMISYINISRRAMVSSSCHTNVNLLKLFHTDLCFWPGIRFTKPFLLHDVPRLLLVELLLFLFRHHCEIFRYYRLRPFTNQSLMESVKFAFHPERI